MQIAVKGMVNMSAHCGFPSSTNRERRRVASVLAAMALTGISGCSNGSGPAPGVQMAQLSGYNHTRDYIHSFYVDKQWGGNVFAFTGGGKFVCCIQYPAEWRAGLTAKVRWSTSSSDPNASGPEATDVWHEAVVSIERYDKPGSRLNVHFLDDSKVRLIISSGSDGQPDYPGPKLPDKPKDFKW